MKQLPLSYTTLGGEVVTVAEPKQRGKHYVEPRGYAAKPGTGPAGETCGSCKNHVINQFARDYHKCLLSKVKWTGGRGSDILVRSPACAKWEATG